MTDFVDVTRDTSDSCGGSTLTLVAGVDDSVTKSTTSSHVSLTSFSGNSPITSNHTSTVTSEPIVMNSVESNRTAVTTSAALTTYISSFSAASASALVKQLVSQDDSDADVTMLASESDDTDAMSTPTNSPAKGHLQTGIRPMTLCRDLGKMMHFISVRFTQTNKT